MLHSNGVSSTQTACYQTTPNSIFNYGIMVTPVALLPRARCSGAQAGFDALQWNVACVTVWFGCVVYCSCNRQCTCWGPCTACCQLLVMMTLHCSHCTLGDWPESTHHYGMLQHFAGGLLQRCCPRTTALLLATLCPGGCSKSVTRQ